MAGQMVKCGVSVIRISGSNAFDAVKRMTSEHSAFPEFRKAVVRNILDVDTKEVIDKGMVICFDEGSRSLCDGDSIVVTRTRRLWSSTCTEVPRWWRRPSNRCPEFPCFGQRIPASSRSAPF